MPNINVLEIFDMIAGQRTSSVDGSFLLSLRRFDYVPLQKWYRIREKAVMNS